MTDDLGEKEPMNIAALAIRIIDVMSDVRNMQNNFSHMARNLDSIVESVNKNAAIERGELDSLSVAVNECLRRVAVLESKQSETKQEVIQ